MASRDISAIRTPWNKGKLVGQKTQRPVQFEMTPSTREVLESWIKATGLRADDCLFPSRLNKSPHLGTRQYARIVDGWVREIGLDSTAMEPTRFGVPSRR